MSSNIKKYINAGKISVHEFLDKNEVSSRLKRVLLSEYHDSYIQNISIYHLDKQRDIGKNAVKEFVKLRGF